MSETVVEESPLVADTGGPTEDVGAADERLAYRGVFARMLVRPEIGAILGSAAIWVFFWAVAGQFGTAGGISGVLDVSATLGIMAVAVAILMIGGEFDLSSGAATGALGIVTILLVKDVGELGGAGLSLWVAIPLSFVVAMGLGWYNGTVVERTGLPSFIVTLATFFVLRGFKLGFSKLTIDNISVGRIDEGHGFEFWRKIFAGVHGRNDHQWDNRDWVYTIAILLGIGLVVVAVFEGNYLRKKAMNPIGAIGFLAGIVGGIVGVAIMHNTDGVGANALAGVVIAASMLVGFGGLAVWRYERHVGADSVARIGRVVEFTVLGVVMVALAAVFAKIIDIEEQQSLLDQLPGWLELLIALAVAVGVGAGFFLRGGETHETPAERRARIVGAIRAGIVGAFAIVAFMFMTTEQGLRAILFVGLSIGGLLVLAIAASSAGRTSPHTRSAILALTAAVTAALALFVRAESVHPKFRTELFSVMMFGAALLFTWAVVSAFFQEREAPDHDADRLSSVLQAVGIVLVVIGIAVRLLFTTTAEIESGIPPANFRMSILWFIAVTGVATFVLGRTKFGSWVFAVGGNKEAARQVGVPAARTKTQLFMIVSGAAWLVGLLLAFRLQTLQSGTGNGLEFEYIIAAVVGGTALTGGRGSVFGAAIGAFIMAMSKQGIGLALWNSDWRFLILGVILLLAVMANNFIRDKAEAMR